MVTTESAPRSIAGDRHGVTAIEYALIASFMAAVLAVAVPGITTAIRASFVTSGTHISTGK